MAHLMDSPERAVRGLAYSPQAQAGQDAALGFEFRLYKRPGARAWFTGSRGGEDYTVVQVGLDVTPVALPVPLYQPLHPLPPGGRAGGPAQAPEGRLPAPAPSARP
jgi:cyanophycinase